MSDTKNLLQEQLQELLKVGVGGKFKNKENYVSLVTKELEFEKAMISGGINRYRKQVSEAQTKRQESTTLYGLVLEQKYVTILSQMINDEVSKMETGQAGNYQTALKLMCQCLPKTAFDGGVFIDNRPSIWDSVSLIVLKNCIDGISDEITLNKLAIQIGTGLMHEARITKFKADNPKEFKNVEKRLQSKNIPQNANRYQYKSKVWAYCINKHNLQFDDWGKEGRLHLGVKMVSFLERLGLVIHINVKLNRTKTVTYVQATPKIIEEIRNFNIKNEALYPKFLPMLMPPRDWENPFTGGYYGRKFNEINKPEEVVKDLEKQGVK